MKKRESFVLAFVFVVIIALASNGCVQVTGQGVDPITHATNYFRGNFFFAKSAAEKLDIFRQTKTTSAMFSAKNVTESGDVEMVKAVAGAVGDAFAAGAKTAVKP